MTARMNRWEAEKMQVLPFSGIRKVSAEAARLKEQGLDVVELTLGRPDFDTPHHIKEAAIRALEEGKVHYTPNLGIPELRNAIARKMKDQNGLEYNPASEILVSVGAAEAIYGVISAFLDPGDEVIIPTPAWVNYVAIPKVFGAKVVEVPMREENDFSLAAEDVAKAITDKTKMICLVSPNNPTGSVIKESDLREIAKLAVKHDLLVTSDEIYEHFIYGEEKHVSIASYEGMRERTIVVNGFSKAFSMTGWRVAWVAAAEPLMQTILRAHQYMVSCATSFAQYGAAAALEGSLDCVKAMTAEFDKRRRYIVEAINQMPKIHCKMPQGAFYVFANIKETGMTSEEFSHYLMHNAYVAAVPGNFFGAAGEGYIRFAYSASLEEIQKAMANMDRAMHLLV